MQAGESAPSHLSPAGTFYFDSLAGITYQNIDGLSNWSTFFSSTNNSFLGQYLPLSGGTLTGGLVANSGVTASTISQTTYIDFTTGSTNPSGVGGRVFFDNTAKALAYYDIQGNNVPIAMGQQLYTRVWNGTGSQIDKGKVIAITGTSNGLPSAVLARNQHTVTSARPIGLSAENIPNNSEGLVLNNGILSGITLNTFANGDTLYLSDTVAGGYVSTTSSLAFVWPMSCSVWHLPGQKNTEQKYSRSLTDCRPSCAGSRIRMMVLALTIGPGFLQGIFPMVGFIT
jgi:hypothetical protein